MGSGQTARAVSTAATPPSMAGRKLKQIRERLGLTLRAVEEATHKISGAERNVDFMVSTARLAQVENEGSLPSMYKMYSLAMVYQLSVDKVLSFYGIDVSKSDQHRQIPLEGQTHLIPTEITDSSRSVSFPVRMPSGFQPQETTFLSGLIQTWDEVPISFLLGLDLKRHKYGYVGLEDRKMYPLLRPGSVVQIDESRKKIVLNGWTSEHERPIYFLELRYSYECCWCSQSGRDLTLIFHPASQLPPRTIRVPDAGEVLGQVVGLAMRITK